MGARSALLRLKGMPHRSLCRSEIDYADPPELRAALKADRPQFWINAAGYTGKAERRRVRGFYKAECLMGNAVLPGIVAAACEDAGVPWGQVSSGCIYNGNSPSAGGFTEADPPNFTFRAGPCSSSTAGRPSVRRCWRVASAYPSGASRIPFESVDNPATT